MRSWHRRDHTAARRAGFQGAGLGLYECRGRVVLLECDRSHHCDPGTNRRRRRLARAIIAPNPAMNTSLNPRYSSPAAAASPGATLPTHEQCDSALDHARPIGIRLRPEATFATARANPTEVKDSHPPYGLRNGGHSPFGVSAARGQNESGDQFEQSCLRSKTSCCASGGSGRHQVRLPARPPFPQTSRLGSTMSCASSPRR